MRLKVFRHEWASLNRIAPDKSYSVIVALTRHDNCFMTEKRSQGLAMGSLFSVKLTNICLSRQMLYLQSQCMYFKSLNGVWKLKRFCRTCVDFKIFVLMSFVFSLNFFFFNFDVQIHKTHLKSYVFEFLFIGDYFIVRPFISWMAKLEVYNVFNF